MASGYLVRILTGDLRIGLKEGLLEDAIAEAFDTTLTRFARRTCSSVTSDARRCSPDKIVSKRLS